MNAAISTSIDCGTTFAELLAVSMHPDVDLIRDILLLHHQLLHGHRNHVPKRKPSSRNNGERTGLQIPASSHRTAVSLARAALTLYMKSTQVHVVKRKDFIGKCATVNIYRRVEVTSPH